MVFRWRTPTGPRTANRFAWLGPGSGLGAARERAGGGQVADMDRTGIGQVADRERIGRGQGADRERAWEWTRPMRPSVAAVASSA